MKKLKTVKIPKFLYDCKMSIDFENTEIDISGFHHPMASENNLIDGLTLPKWLVKAIIEAINDNIQHTIKDSQQKAKAMIKQIIGDFRE